MFHNKIAWFSSSVPQECQSFWLREGGTITSWTTADYLFSQDASCPDTQRIYLSRDYLFNKVTVFHSFFLCACEKRQSVKSVCIGHYVLPPESVQQEVRNVIGRLIWECEDDEISKSAVQAEDDSDGEVSERNSEASDTSEREQLHGGLGSYPISNTLTGYVSMDSLPRYSGSLCDFHMGCFRCYTCNTHCCFSNT